MNLCTKKLKKTIIKIIDSTPFNETKTFGDVLFDVVLDNIALVAFDDGDISVLTKEQKDQNDALLKISYVFSLLDELVKNNLALCIPQGTRNASLPSLYYKRKGDLSVSAKLNTYDIGDSLSLEINRDDNYCAIRKGTQQIVSGSILENSGLSRRIEYYCNACIYPTSSLQKYIDNGYRTHEEFSLHLSKIAIRVAILVACISPIISVWISNKIGYTTIEKCQFTQLIRRADTNVITTSDSTTKQICDSSAIKLSSKTANDSNDSTKINNSTK